MAKRVVAAFVAFEAIVGWEGEEVATRPTIAVGLVADGDVHSRSLFKRCR